MKSMEIIDANIVLRYLLNDHEVLSKKSLEVVENKNVHIPFEVFAEIIYVLEKVYLIPRYTIKNTLTSLLRFQNITTADKNTLIYALEIFESKNIDFVDSILVAFSHVNNMIVHSFDKQLNKLLKIR